MVFSPGKQTTRVHSDLYFLPQTGNREAAQSQGSQTHGVTTPDFYPSYIHFTFLYVSIALQTV